MSPYIIPNLTYKNPIGITAKPPPGKYFNNIECKKILRFKSLQELI